MTIDDLTGSPGEWLRGQGPRGDIVISSRVRLARNLAGFPFLSRASPGQQREIQQLLRQKLEGEDLGLQLLFLDIEGVNELDRQVLVERHLISRQHADGEGTRAVAVSTQETVSLMINEEDHLRIQVLRSGFQLEESWAEINRIDELIEQRVDYAFHPKYGYLTACPTNVGTGIRVSVMLHLPALRLTGEIEKVFNAARELRLAIRGLYGEGTEATGDFFQVSNQISLGKSEEEIIAEFKQVVIPQIIDYEQRARETLVHEKPLAVDDKIWRAIGLLRSARTMSSEETLSLLSHVRMGITMGRINGIIDLDTVNELFLMTQPAHLQKARGARMDGEERSIFRAEYIRQRLDSTN